jgi:hypothetical protein
MAHFHLRQQFALIEVSLHDPPLTCEGIIPILGRLLPLKNEKQLSAARYDALALDRMFEEIPVKVFFRQVEKEHSNCLRIENRRKC